MNKIAPNSEESDRPDARFAPVRWVVRAMFVICLIGMIPVLLSNPQMAAKMRAALDRIGLSADGGQSDGASLDLAGEEKAQISGVTYMKSDQGS